MRKFLVQCQKEWEAVLISIEESKIRYRNFQYFQYFIEFFRILHVVYPQLKPLSVGLIEQIGQVRNGGGTGNTSGA